MMTAEFFVHSQLQREPKSKNGNTTTSAQGKQSFVAFLTRNQYWQTSGPKFGPTRYPADRSIHWAGIGLGILSPGPNRTQFGRTDMYAKCGSGKRFFRSIGSVFACGKPGKTSVEPLMKWDYPTRHFLSSTVPKSL